MGEGERRKKRTEKGGMKDREGQWRETRERTKGGENYR